MKKVKICLICGKHLGKKYAYHAQVQYLHKNPMTGEEEIRARTGIICPICNSDCGYQSSKRKLEEFKKHLQENEENDMNTSSVDNE